MVAELLVILVMFGPCVIWTAFSLAWSIGFCANTGADSISDAAKNMDVRFIRLSPMKGIDSTSDVSPRARTPACKGMNARLPGYLVRRWPHLPGLQPRSGISRAG